MVWDQLGRIETALRDAVRTDTPVVAEPAGHLVAAGGKRFRPLLVVLAAHFGDPAGRHVEPAAVVVELTHLATLYHDDVMDEAAVRRGAPSANSRWTNSVAILTGDFLFARASHITADLGPDAVRLLSRTFERLVTGQIRETTPAPAGTEPVAHYLGVLGDKTGSLMVTSAQFGAEFGGADPALVAPLKEYGEAIGIAFQLSDDLLDIASESSESGKTPGTDLREGVHTLPVLYALSSTDPAEARLRELLSSGPLVDDADHAEALDLLRRSPAMGQARMIVREYADRAAAIAAALPDVPARRALTGLADYVVARSA
ncbi:MAG: polyprenyl synthetase family protein [Mycobacteriales bacterium]